MGTTEYFSGLLRKVGISNFLILGIVIIVLWLLISGFKKGLKKRNRGSKEEGEDND